LVFTGERWQSLDLRIHGQELRWHCAECEAYFKEREKKAERRSRADLILCACGRIACNVRDAN
jgi:hypothetical protein